MTHSQSNQMKYDGAQSERHDPTIMKPIGTIHTELSTKFGVPRQSGVVKNLKGKIVFDKEYRVNEAFKGLEDYSHLWIIWVFSEVSSTEWTPTVRPPRLGGNKRMGVFGTRSPFRPNPIGLSSVKLEKIVYEEPDGPVLHVSGIDMMNGTPILDIKPYLPYTDSHPEATGGFTDHYEKRLLDVVDPEELMAIFEQEQQDTLTAILAQDPRPAYQKNPERIYGLDFAGHDVRFRVEGNRLEVLEIK
jgi:tRNA-Thr(GGU) m(6)t(6)A37 methyltransferase TsaA